VPQPKWQYTHAVTIHAPVQKVWPWLVQIGQGRGGWYSYTLLENIAGCKIKNAERILPEYQDLKIGDGVHMHPKAPAMPVADLKPGRAMVLGGLPEPDKDGKYFGSTQAFYLEEYPGGTTRFIVRGRSDYSKDAAVWAGPGMMEPISAMMNRKMMLTIKERAERRAKKPLRDNFNLRLDDDFRLHRVGHQAVLLSRLQGAHRTRPDHIRLLVSGGDLDHRPEAQLGKNLGPVQLDQLGAFRLAVIREQLKLEAFSRPDEHHHDARVGGSHKSVFGGKHAGVPLGVRWG
jgi:hypothetical protein